MYLSEEGADEGPEDKDRNGGAGGAALVAVATGQQGVHDEGVDRP